MPIVVGGVPNPAPFAPTLLTPPTATYENLATTPKFAWRYNPGQLGRTQTAWAMRRKISGAATYQFWNSSTSAWQSTLVYNSGTVQVFTFPAGVWVDGRVYNWSVSTQDANGSSPFATDFIVNAQATPTVSVTSPAGTVTSATPTVSWTPGLPSGVSQTSYRAVIYDAAQYQAATFVPGSGPSVWDSGVVATAYVFSVELATIPVFLPNSTTYRAYVQITETGGQTSAWAYSAFTTAYTEPKTPTLTISPVNGNTTTYPRFVLALQGHDNLLSATDASFESTLGTWVATNATLSRTTAKSYVGRWSLEAKATAIGEMVLHTAIGTAAYPIKGGAEYTAVARLLAATTARDVVIQLDEYAATGAHLVGVQSTAFLDSTSAWVQAKITVPRATANAAYASLRLYVHTVAATEIHYVDAAGIFIGTDTTWGPGGLVGHQEAILLRSDGAYVRGASVNHPATFTSVRQTVTVDDAEVIVTATYSYKGRVLVTKAPGQDVVSTAATSGTSHVTSTRFWEFDPTDLSTAVSAQIIHFQPQVTEQSTAHLVMGQPTPNVIANAMGNTDGQMTFWTNSASGYEGLVKLLKSQKTVYVSDPFGDQYGVTYARFGPQTGGLSAGVGNKIKTTQLEPSTASAPVRTIQVTFVAQPRPFV